MFLQRRLYDLTRSIKALNRGTYFISLDSRQFNVGNDRGWPLYYIPLRNSRWLLL